MTHSKPPLGLWASLGFVLLKEGQNTVKTSKPRGSERSPHSSTPSARLEEHSQISFTLQAANPRAFCHNLSLYSYLLCVWRALGSYTVVNKIMNLMNHQKLIFNPFNLHFENKSADSRWNDRLESNVSLPKGKTSPLCLN